MCRNFKQFRILVCGGDGSVGWVMTELDKQNLTNKVYICVYLFRYFEISPGRILAFCNINRRVCLSHIHSENCYEFLKFLCCSDFFFFFFFFNSLGNLEFEKIL